MLFRRFAALALLAALCGCALFPSRAQRAQRNSPDYKVGYADGCSTAGNQGANSRESSMVRDDQAYESNPAYRSGWGTGFNTCRTYQSPAANSAGTPGGGILTDPYSRR